MSKLQLGTIVLIDRDEKLYPSKGSWPRYRGRLGTIVAINKRDKEYGVSWSTNVTNIRKENTASWFLAHELRAVEVAE